MTLRFLLDSALLIKKIKILDFKLAFFGQNLYTNLIRNCGVNDKHLAYFPGSFYFFRLTGLCQDVIFLFCSLRKRIDTPSGVDRPRRGSVVHRSPPQPVPPPRPFYARSRINAVNSHSLRAATWNFLFTADLNYDFSASGAVEFTEENALPGAELQRSTFK